MRVLVTGANGMLATNIIENLLSKGYMVRGLLRDKRRYKAPLHHNLELMEGDFTQLHSAREAVAGCDIIIHSAAITSQSVISYEQYQRVNVEASKQLANLAIEAGVQRFIYVSTANTVGYGTPSDAGDESLQMMPPYSLSLYVRSKHEAESALLALRDRLDIVVANPTFMIGRYGNKEGSNRIFRMSRRVTLCPKGGRNFIDVEEAAEGVVLAMLRGKRGERYLICGENLSYSEFFKMMPQVKYLLNTPNWLLRSVGAIGDILRACGVRCDMSSVNMEMLTLNIGYSGGKARRELNFNPRPISGLICSDFNQ